MTSVISKQLLPVYDKPMIYYSLGTLMLAGIRQILIISTPDHLPHFETLLGNGAKWGIELQYKVQAEPKGIPQALTLGKDFVGDDHVCLGLGDNIFHGSFLGRSLQNLVQKDGATIFAYEVEDARSYGVVEFHDGKAVSLEEKPEIPKSRYAIPGLYFFDNQATSIVETLNPSPRGELEIIDLLQIYMRMNKLNVIRLPRGSVWLDSGTPKSLHDAATYVRVIEERQGLKLACLEEIAWRQDWIDNESLSRLARSHEPSDYGKYLSGLIGTIDLDG